MTPLQHPSSYWTAQNIILEARRVGRETNTGLIKIGDGVTPWNELAYYDEINQYTPATQPVANAYTATYKAPLVLGLFPGLPLRVLFATANTGPCTINFNGFGAIPIRKQGTTALSSGDIGAGTLHILIYDGTNFQIQTLYGGTGMVGPGTVNRIPKFTAATTIGDTSTVVEVGGSVGIGTTSPSGRLHSVGAADAGTHFRIDNSVVTNILNVNGRQVGIGVVASSVAALSISVGALGTTTGVRVNGINSGIGYFIPSGSSSMVFADWTTFSSVAAFSPFFLRVQTPLNNTKNHITLDAYTDTSTAPGTGLGGGIVWRLGTIANTVPTADHGRITVAWTSGTTSSHMAFSTFSGTLTEKMRITGTGQIGIGISAPDASAKMQIDSTTQGFLPPRMTNAQRVAIVAPAIGLLVYCTDAVEGLYVNKSTGWTFII
jgi:hypothetical protein